MPEIVGRLRPPRLAAAPASPAVGEEYYDTAQNAPFYWDGTQWVTMKPASGTIYDCDQVGTVKAYAGATIPTGWMLCDGSALQRSSYPDLFAAIGTTWGAGDGSTTFNIPDFRSRMLVAAGAGTGLTNRVVAAKGGEELHVLLAAESGQNGNAAMGTESADHSHGVNINTGYVSNDHSHAWSGGGYVPSAGAAWGNIAPNGVTGSYNMAYTSTGVSSPTGTAGISANHTHNVSGNTGGRSAGHTHAMTARNADSGHNTMPPWCAVAFIIKVIGLQINAGGALQGATGQRGSIWYMYNGVGTPAAGTFVGELDGDSAIRQSDGEIFKRVSGAWVDQSFSMRQSAPITAARGYRTTAGLAMTASNWTRIPLDATSFDTASLISGGRINIATPGYYQVNAAVFASVSATGTYTAAIASIYKNGVQGSSAYNYAAIQTYQDSVVADVIYCNAGDYLELYGYTTQSGVTVYASTQYTFLSAVLIAAGPGPQGARGANWFTYTGAGTPAVGTFLNEQDNDMAVRASDGEVFRRISGAWTDQNYKITTGQNTMDIWHLVGGSGEPAFTNAWANYGAGFNVAGFRKMPDGKVKLKGLLTSGTAGAMFTLPVGYRPVAQVLGITECQTGPNRMDITPGGVVTSTYTGGWCSLEGIEFDTESVSQMATGPQGPQGNPGAAYGGNAQVFTSLPAGTLCTFSGLNGNVDRMYEVVMELNTIAPTANFGFWLIVNGLTTGTVYVQEQRIFNTDGATMTVDQAANYATTYPPGGPGYFMGHTDWTTSAGVLISRILIGARAISGLSRTSRHEGSFIPSVAATYNMTWKGSTNWVDGTTNITSLVLKAVGGGTGSVTGRATLRVVS